MLTHLQSKSCQPQRVVILGAAGFIPQALAAHLATAGIGCQAIGRTQVDLESPESGAALAALLQPTDAVVMAAALTPDKGRDAATLMRNLRMAEAVTTAIARRPVAHVAYLSSDAVYDWRLPLVSEATPPSPTDLYGLMHRTREQMLADACTSAGVPYCVLRPCAVYGPGDTHNSYGPNRFARTATGEGRIQLFGAGEETRDHVFIGDVAALIGQTLAHRSTGLLNLVSGRSATFAQVAEAVAGLCTRPVTIEAMPRRGPVTHRHFDATAMLRAFPEHRPTSLTEGLPALFGRS